jgi:hypothetical protein
MVVQYRGKLSKLKARLRETFLAKPFFKAKEVDKKPAKPSYMTVSDLTKPWPKTLIISVDNESRLMRQLKGFETFIDTIPLWVVDEARIDSPDYGAEGETLIMIDNPRYMIGASVCNGGSRRTSFYLTYVANPML